MSAPADTATLDRRSLSLADWRTALKRRVKRPGGPKDRWMLVYSALYAALAVENFLIGDLVVAAVNVLLAAVVWPLAFYSKSDPRAHPYALAWLLMLPMNFIVSVATGG